MKFIHLKAQIAVQEVKSKAREVIDRFIALCKKAGGRAETREYELVYRATCIMPRKAYTYVLPRKNGGLYIELQDLTAPEWRGSFWVEDFKKDEVPNIRDIVATHEKGGKIAYAHVKIVDRPTGATTDEGFISGYFKKIELSVSKDFERLSMNLE